MLHFQKLNMTLGKPSLDQLELMMPMLDTLNSKSDCHDSTGLDCRNYGELTGSCDAGNMFGNYMGVSADDTYLRIAPSFLSSEELKTAMEVFCISACLAAVDMILGLP